MVAWLLGAQAPNVALSLYVALLISRTLHARTEEFSRNKEKYMIHFIFCVILAWIYTNSMIILKNMKMEEGLENMY
jgi:hypothetical protein